MSVSPSASEKSAPSAPSPVSRKSAVPPIGNVPPLKAALVAAGGRLARPVPVSDQGPSPSSLVIARTSAS